MSSIRPHSALVLGERVLRRPSLEIPARLELPQRGGCFSLPMNPGNIPAYPVCCQCFQTPLAQDMPETCTSRAQAVHKPCPSQARCQCSRGRMQRRNQNHPFSGFVNQPDRQGNIQHPTSNIELPMGAIGALIGCWTFEVGCWRFFSGSGDQSAKITLRRILPPRAGVRAKETPDLLRSSPVRSLQNCRFARAGVLASPSLSANQGSRGRSPSRVWELPR